MYAMRAVGGTLYFAGVLVMVYNLWATAKAGSPVEDEAAEAPALEPTYTPHGKDHWHRWIERKPVQFLVIALVTIS